MKCCVNKKIVIMLLFVFCIPYHVSAAKNEMLVELQTRYRNGDVMVDEFKVSSNSRNHAMENIFEWKIKNASQKKLVLYKHVNESSPLTNDDVFSIFNHYELRKMNKEFSDEMKSIRSFLQIPIEKKKVNKGNNNLLVLGAYIKM